MQQTLSTSYPRLLRLFHEFFAKIAVHTDTVYTQSHQRCVSVRTCVTLILCHYSPETVLVLRALSNFESTYLTRSTTRLNETISQAFSSGTRAPPGMNDGVNIARTITNELDSARFDPLLVKSVARNVVGCLDSMLGRVDGLVRADS
jgi:conserved oligomeric Golgi complex subunit 5